MSDRLRIQTFGRYLLELDGQPVTGFASRKADALFIYLACQPATIPRDIAATLLWGDIPQKRALANLSVMLSSLRKQVGDYLHTTRHTLAFAHDQPHWLDVALFEQAIARQSGELTRTSAQQLSQAVALYQGDFLAGFYVRHAPDFEAWMLLKQERLRQQAIGAWQDLITFFAERHQYDSALNFARQWVQTDPLDEVAHRQLIELLWLDGQQAAAMAQFEACRTQLVDELGVKPEAETMALFDRIQQNPVITHRRTQTTTPAVTRFFGRNEERTYLHQLINDPYTRLVTIVGTGGAGKSRLALELVREVEGTFKDGATFVSLAAVDDSAGVWAQMARSLGYKLRDSSDPSTQLLELLREQERLLVLDNLEQLLTDEVIDFILQLVTQSAELMVIVTSRERLNLQAEAVIELRGLPSDQASRLFSDRAHRQRPNIAFEPTHLTELCELVTGLPLALELSASLVRALSLEEIVANVRTTLDTLATTMRDIPVRHRSIRAVFDSSWQHLAVRSDPIEAVESQRVFRQAAVFRDGFTLAAAQAVLNLSPPTISHLIDRSLWQQGDDGRYQQHPLMWQFAQEKLAADQAEYEATRHQHAHYFGRWLHKQESHLFSGSPEYALQPIRQELENIRSAWRWAVRIGDFTIINQMGDSIMQSFDLLGLYPDALQMAQLAADQLPSVDLNDPVSSQAHGRVLGLVSAFSFRLGDYDTAWRESHRAIAILEAWQPHIAYAHAWVYAGAAAFGHGDFATVRHCWLQAIDAYEAVGSVWGQAVAYGNASEVEMMLDNHKQAQQYAERGYALAQQLNNVELAGSCLQTLSMIALQAGDVALARRYAEEQVAAHRRIGHQAHLANALGGLANVAYQQRKWADAEGYLRESVAILRKNRNHLYMVNHLIDLAQVHLAMGKLDEAEKEAREAIGQSMATDSADLLLRALALIAEIYAQMAHWERAVLLACYILQSKPGGAETKRSAEQILQQSAAHPFLQQAHLKVRNRKLTDIAAWLV